MASACLPAELLAQAERSDGRSVSDRLEARILRGSRDAIALGGLRPMHSEEATPALSAASVGDQMTSPWRQAILLVCGAFGPARGEVRPYGPRAWDRLAGRLGEVGVDPAEILSMSAPEIERTLMIPAAEGERLRYLLARSGQLAIELERLESRGIWVTTLGDADYPVRLRQRLGTSAPPLLYGSGPRALPGSPGVAIVGSRDADAAALEFTERLAVKAAAEGLAVVSGGARGIDSASMSAAAERGATTSSASSPNHSSAGSGTATPEPARGRVAGARLAVPPLERFLRRRGHGSQQAHLCARGPRRRGERRCRRGRNRRCRRGAAGGLGPGLRACRRRGTRGQCRARQPGAIALPDEIDEEFQIGSLVGSEARTPAHAVRAAAPTLWGEV